MRPYTFAIQLPLHPRAAPVLLHVSAKSACSMHKKNNDVNPLYGERQETRI